MNVQQIMRKARRNTMPANDKKAKLLFSIVRERGGVLCSVIKERNYFHTHKRGVHNNSLMEWIGC